MEWSVTEQRKSDQGTSFYKIRECGAETTRWEKSPSMWTKCKKSNEEIGSRGMPIAEFESGGTLASNAPATKFGLRGELSSQGNVAHAAALYAERNC